MTTDCREMIDELNRELDGILYSISHDLRAPLRSIDGFSLAVLEDYDGQLDETGRDYLRRIRKGGLKINQYIDGLLAISRQSRGEVVKEEVNLSNLARETWASLKASHEGPSPAFMVQDGVTALIDRRLARFLFMHLLDNCWKFTRDVRDARVEFGMTDADGSPVYFFRDNGVGFDMEYAQDRLFGPFQRMHAEGEFEGLGVGLATAKRIINRHEGRIWARSEVGKGTTIYFSLEDI